VFWRTCIYGFNSQFEEVFMDKSMDGSIRGGVIIVGSLFWDMGGYLWDREGNKKWFDTLREGWRSQNLDMANAIQIYFPTDYGRLSGEEPKIATMTVSPTYPDGKAYFVPLKAPITDFAALEVQAEKLASAEGMRVTSTGHQLLATSWGIISVMFHTTMNDSRRGWLASLRDFNEIKSKAETSWARRGRSSDTAGYVYDTFWHGIEVSKRAVDKNALLTVLKPGEWLKAVNEKDQQKLDQCNFALCTVTRPDAQPLTDLEIAQSVANDYSRNYFRNNYEKGLRTARDEQIIEVMAEKVDYAEFGPFEIKLKSEFGVSNDRMTLSEAYRLYFYRPGAGKDGKYSTNPLFGLFLTETNRNFSGGLSIHWLANSKNSQIAHQGDMSSAKIARFQKDGNFVVYSAEFNEDSRYQNDTALWSTNTYRRNDKEPNRFLRIYDEGCFEIWADGKRLWSSDDSKPVEKIDSLSINTQNNTNTSTNSTQQDVGNEGRRNSTEEILDL
jgi:hypothetical protein